MSGMSMRRPVSLRQSGEINALAIPLVLMVIFFLGAAGFGYWAFTGRQDYKNNVDQKVAVAVAAAVKEEGVKKDLAFAEEIKKPNTVYEGPSAYGSVHLEYPKTWSVYINSNVSNPQPLDAYLNPQTVPSVGDQASVFALRVKVLTQRYATVVKTLEASVKAKKITTQPFALEKVPDQVGIKAEGLINPSKKTNGVMIVLPLRDKTIQVWTENPQYLNDFNAALKNMSYSP
jgi:hypothetical protein